MNGFTEQTFEAILGGNYVNTEKSFPIPFNTSCESIYATTKRTTIDIGTVFALQILELNRTGFKGAVIYFKNNGYGYSNDNAIYFIRGY